jgi:hypothetical protein
MAFHPLQVMLGACDNNLPQPSVLHSNSYTLCPAYFGVHSCIRMPDDGKYVAKNSWILVFQC